ncbi:hypothetical protein PIIN_10534 [Serendipita indica DSM 11827]|uniref:Uncharacterized protein n=1 Tax=Serendipita indica (strain DSM 11827) TaxID=1109443 RepID=G4TYZ8_SERID|nr:hypothetical protein PIIN_10534 [Serendipita indica DSM 11827]
MITGLLSSFSVYSSARSSSTSFACPKLTVPGTSPVRPLSRSIAHVTTQDSPNEPLPKTNYDPAPLLDHINRILSSGRASQQTLTQLALELITPAHYISSGRSLLVDLLSPLPTTASGGMLNVPYVPKDQAFTLTRSITSNLHSWAELLTDGQTRLTDPSPVELSTCDNKVYSDASTQGGIGIVVDKQWYHLPWRNPPCNTTGHAEAIGLEMSLEILMMEYGLRNTYIKIYSDCDEVVNLWTHRRPGAVHRVIDPVFGRILHNLHNSNCWMELEKVRSGRNMADNPSRNKPPGWGYTKGHWPGTV